uniref:PID domain-containing protein n=1 Tax=Glossina brevipalpis TaxID=37001 RepID=A0A1A9X203_9MUSC
MIFIINKEKMATSNMNGNEMLLDEVDFTKVSNHINNNNNENYKNNLNQRFKHNKVPKTSFNEKVPNIINNNNNNDNTDKKLSKDKLTIFNFGRKLLQKPTDEINDKKELKALKGKEVEKKNSNEEETEKYNQSFQDNGFTEYCNTSTTTTTSTNTLSKQQKYAKTSSLSRLLNKKAESEYKTKSFNEYKFNTYNGRRKSNGPYLERFKRYTKEEGDPASIPVEIKHVTKDFDYQCINSTFGQQNQNTPEHSTSLTLQHLQENHSDDLGIKAIRTLSRGLSKLFWRRTHSVNISSPDPEYKVSYLGNVLTGWAKGEGCVEKQLNTLWRNYTQNNKPDVIMRIKVCASGLKATTRQHGLTEYWANRITHCCAPKNYPRVFCWIYRHEGRKLKHELRCHAVLCSKEKIVHEICDTLKANLECALREFKREKILKQNARLSLANAVYDNPSLPRRKILLSVGSNNYRPPLERSKSAPKLMAIEEAIGEEGEEAEETNEPEMKSCCQKDSLYPAMTLGRRRCRRGHSIRRTGKTRPLSCDVLNKKCDELSCASKSRPLSCGVLNKKFEESLLSEHQDNETNIEQKHKMNDNEKLGTKDEELCTVNYGSDDSDDFDKILKHNDYDADASLAKELLPYFERQLHKQTSSSCSSLTDLKDVEEEEEPLSLLPIVTINSDPRAHPEADFDPSEELIENNENCQISSNAMISLRRSGVCSDGEGDYLADDGDDDESDLYFRQAAILNLLHRHSIRKMAHLSLSSDEGSSSLETNASGNSEAKYSSPHHQIQSSISSESSSVSVPIPAPRKQINNDSADDGSISSGCETSSTVTNHRDDVSSKYQFPNSQQINEKQNFTTNSSEMPKKNCKQFKGDDTFCNISSNTITLKLRDPRDNYDRSDVENSKTENSCHFKTVRLKYKKNLINDSDSECSDESGYVEYQEREQKNHGINNRQPKPIIIKTKPQIPPKPMPRKFLSTTNDTAV